MNSPTPQVTNTKFIELLKTYWAWRRLWIATTVLFGGLGLVYVLFLKNDMWTASQGLIVRDEANGAVMRLGRFQSQTEMKAAQETILEMARNTMVLREALLEVGPAKSLFSFSKISENWPTQREVAELAEDSIGVRAPQGAEFGTTEVIYLDIKQHARQRALALNRAVCQALDNRLRQVRVARADGVINELVRASNMATDELKKAADQLQIVEREAGADLADLRGLSEANGSGSAARNQLETVKTELRQVETLHASLQSDLALLKDTQADPDRILSAPASILSAHPGLKKLREGLADAQLNTSQLRGRFTSSHPMVYVATSAESEIKQQLQSELAQATSNSAREVAVSQARLDKLKRQQQQLEERLERLARIRTEHEQLNQEVRSRTKILQDAERQLADTRAARDAALTTSLLTRIDDPVLGERPVGPGRSTILAAMTMAGLCFGLGIVFLLTPLDGSTPDSGRWNEQLGRRLSDRFPWLSDQSPNGAPRRRRNDVERRQRDADASVKKNAEAPVKGRRQSDQWTAETNATSSVPEIKEEDPSVVSRLDDMLLSELAAMAPIPRQTIAEPSTPSLAQSPPNESAPVATIDSDWNHSASEANALEDSALEGSALEQSTTEHLASNRSSSNEQPLMMDRGSEADAKLKAHAADTMGESNKPAKPPIRPRLRSRDAAAGSLSRSAAIKPVAESSTGTEPKAISPAVVPTQTATVASVTPSNTVPAVPRAAAPSPSVSRQPSQSKSIQSKPPQTQPPQAQSAQARPVSSQAVEPRVKKSMDKTAIEPEPQAILATMPAVADAPQARSTKSDPSVSAQTRPAKAQPKPTPVSSPSDSAPVRTPISTPVSTSPANVSQASNTPRANASGNGGEVQPVKPTKPGLNLFRPNQAMSNDAGEQRSNSAQPPSPPAKPKAPAPEVGFETPIEGGLAGIGLPTQKLPDSFQFRNNSK